MLLRPLRDDEKDLYNQVVHHPLQSWEWGEFRRKTGLSVERIGFFDQGKLKHAVQATFHSLPLFGGTVGYVPRGDMPDEEQLAALKQIGQRNQALFVKLEPNVAEKVGVPSGHANVAKFLADNDTVPGRPLFTQYSFQVDLTQSEEKLQEKLNSKTRYNISVAAKHGVQIVENTSAAGVERHLEILSETTKRQGFYAHSPRYFRTMWETLGQSGMMRVFEAHYQGEVLVSWIMFIFNGVLYYPYGASRAIHREVMASNLMMWEMIRFGKAQGCTVFDMWGSLGPEPDSKDPWFGFHRFKKGYGGDLVQFLGTYDLVLNQPLYKVFRVVENVRWKWLRFRARLPF